MRITAGLGVVCAAIAISGACGGDNNQNGDGGGTDGSQSNDGTTKNDGTSGNDGSTGNDSSGGDGGCSAPQIDFPSTSIFYQDISKSAVDSAWATILGSAFANGWGTNAFQLDPSFELNYADSCVATRTFTQPSKALPDCDNAPVPVPAGGKIEGNSDYFCKTSGDDCHMIIYAGTRLFEIYQGSITGGQATGGTFTSSCEVIWDLNKDYWQPGSPYSRGDGCNGSDAADVPIAPLLLQKAEIAAHNITHAMRFTIANPKIDNTYYVHPATHLGGSGTPGVTVPYGGRLRLKASYNVSSLATPEAQAVATALQKYGMFMDDGTGGSFFVSATTDITQVIDTHALKALLPTDFEMVDGGTRVNFHQQNCTRTPITQ
jgi:serine/threonine-protein kinase